MKGFGIYVKNDLLEAKHIKAMHGERSGAIWLYLWILDKMTIIDSEKGEGKVLGGKPVRFEEVNVELGINRRTYIRWVEILRVGGYIKTLRTPYGLVITVFKAKKIFGNKIKSDVTSESHLNKSDVPEESHLSARTVTSNKDRTIYKTDNTMGVTKQIAEIINVFKPINPHINFGNKTFRNATEEMLDVHGFEKLMEITKYAVSVQGRQYSPTITNPYQLKERMAALAIYNRKNKSTVLDLDAMKR